MHILCVFHNTNTTKAIEKKSQFMLDSTLLWPIHRREERTKKKNDWRSENGTDAWTRSEKIRKTHTNTLLFSCHVAADSLSAIVVHKYSSRLLVCVTGLCMVKAGNGKAARQSDSSQTPFKRIVKKKVQFSLVWLLVKRTQHNTEWEKDTRRFSIQHIQTYQIRFSSIREKKIYTELTHSQTLDFRRQLSGRALQIITHSPVLTFFEVLFVYMSDIVFLFRGSV